MFWKIVYLACAVHLGVWIIWFFLSTVDYSRLVDWFQAQLCKLTGRRFWYRVTFQGKDSDGRVRWTATTDIGVSLVKTIGDGRKLKKAQFGRGVKRTFSELPIAKDFQITVEPVTYLGWY